MTQHAQPLATQTSTAATRAAARAAKIERQRLEDIAFIAKTLPVRKSKKIALKNAVWKADQPASWKDNEPSSSRKRTSSTVQASEVTKKAREAAQSDEDLEPAASKSKKSSKSATTTQTVDEDPQLKAKPSKKPLKSTSTARRYAAPPIDIDSASEPEAPKAQVRVDFTKVSSTGKNKNKNVSANAKTVKTPSLPVAPKNAVVTSTRKPTRLVAESASEDDSAASDHDAEGDADLSDEGDVEFDDDAAPDAEEFVQEVPQLMAKRRAADEEDLQDVDSGAESREVSRELDDDVAPRKGKALKKAVSAPSQLFDSEEDDDAMLEAPPRKGKSVKKAAQSQLFESDEEEDDDDVMSGAPPRQFTQDRRPRYRGDSDVDMHEAIADALVSVPHGRHSRRSSTGSGWSSGMDLVIPESEPDSDQASEPEVPAPRPVKKARKVTAARQKKADLERPEVRAPAAASQDDSADEPINRPEASWHPSTRLTLPAPNKDIGLTVQTPEVQFVMRGTTDMVRMNLFFTTFFPLLSVRVGWIRPQMIAAASVSNSGYILEYVLERLRTDPTFASILSSLAIDRVTLTRGNIKRCAVTIVMVMYQLVGLTPAEVKIRVEELLKDHRYIFPVDAKTGQMLLDLPFHHPALKHIIKHEIMSSRLLKAQGYDRFPATHPKHPEAREVADPMVSIAATGAFAALSELRLTGERQAIPFSEETFEDIYLIHMKTLEDTRKSAPITTHKVLHQLFNDVTNATKAVKVAAGSSATLINLVDVADSD